MMKKKINTFPGNCNSNFLTLLFPLPGPYPVLFSAEAGLGITKWEPELSSFRS